MSRKIKHRTGYLVTDIQLACKTDRMAAWYPYDEKGDALNADPRVIVAKAATAELAEAMVLLRLARTGQRCGTKIDGQAAMRGACVEAVGNYHFWLGAEG